MKFSYTAEELADSNRSVPRSNATAPAPKKKSKSGCLTAIVLLFVALLIAGGLWYALKDAPQDRESGEADQTEIQSPESEITQGHFESQAKQDKPITKKDLAVLFTYLETSRAELNHLCEFVRTSPFLNDNAQYAPIARDIVFYIQSTNDEINAFATISTNSERQIVCLAGEPRFAKTLGLAVAAAQFGDKTALVRLAGKMRLDRDCNDYRCFSTERAIEIIDGCNLLPVALDEKKRKRAQSIAAGAIIATLAHETGHHVLGHLSNGVQARLSDEISRNQEREADSVAASIMSISEFGEYQFVGRLIAHWIKWKKEEALGMTANDATTHPISRERFENLVRADRAHAAEFGFTVDE